MMSTTTCCVDCHTASLPHYQKPETVAAAAAAAARTGNLLTPTATMTESCMSCLGTMSLMMQTMRSQTDCMTH